MHASTGPKYDYTRRTDHVIMNEMLGYIDQILIDASEYLYVLYRTWSTHYITNYAGKDVLEVLVSGRRQAWWRVRPLLATHLATHPQETKPSNTLDPGHSVLIQRYYAQLVEHQMKNGNTRMVLHCRIRRDENEHTHSNVIVLMRDEMTGQWNATLIEPGADPEIPDLKMLIRA